METFDFINTFETLTENKPFPWQIALYERFLDGQFPESCHLPTGLGKTMVVPIWLIALAVKPAVVPRRLVYVVNRRTVVDQTTNVAIALRDRLAKVPQIEAALRCLCAIPLPGKEPSLAISTLRGQFADNREWSADPCRPALIVGTVDMIGSRLLFSGYGVGSKTRPLHAGFLGQDTLLVHDEAHLEPAFQKLIVAIRAEQVRCHEQAPLRVMELTATSRTQNGAFTLSDEDHANSDVRKRVDATKNLHIHPLADEKKLAETIAAKANETAKQHPGTAILIFVLKVEHVDKITNKLPAGSFEQLTGTLRGLERDQLVESPIFQRFMPPPKGDETTRKQQPKEGTVFLVCTSAGEVGVDISADHLVCDLTPFDSMAQRFGRVNRFGKNPDTRIEVFHPAEFKQDHPYEIQREKTLKLLVSLNGSASPAAINKLCPENRQAAFSPQPTILDTSDIHFDSWALTTIPDKLPGRPDVEPYLHGISDWQPPETHVGWREEVGLIVTDELITKYPPDKLLEDYPLKPHELLRDTTKRVFQKLQQLVEKQDAGKEPIWLVDHSGDCTVTTLGEIADEEELNYRIVLLPPRAGGLTNGLLHGNANEANDVADEYWNEEGKRRRIRVWNDDEEFAEKSRGMRLIWRIEFGNDDDEPAERRSWHWFERPWGGDSDGSKFSYQPVTLECHTDDVVSGIRAIVAKLNLPEEMQRAFILAAEWHDLGKQRKVFQTVLGNRDYPRVMLAKSGRKGGAIGEHYRHELGSLCDILNPSQPYFAKFSELSEEAQDLLLHLIATHHGRGRPHFPRDETTHPANGPAAEAITLAVPRRYARLQRRYGRWRLAYLESLLRAADYAASANPSKIHEEGR